MNIKNYSLQAHKPCFVLKWPSCRIMIDAPVDFSPFFSFLPHVYQSLRLKNAHTARRFNIDYLKEIFGKVYVQSPPEISHVSPDSIKMETIDAILVSNYDSFIGLPFFTENTGFNGKIYVTELAFQYGKLLMEEMLEFMSRIDYVAPDKKWKQEDICGKFANPPTQNPEEWHRFYTSTEMHSCLSRVVTLSFNQTIDLFRVQVTPVASGHTYGSAYWTLHTENERIAYLAASNPVSTDVKSLEITPLRKCDYILVTNLTRLVDTNAASMGSKLMGCITETLRGNGSVLLPISPVGPIFEMIEAISDVITTTHGISTDTPIYLISPVAKTAIALASISAEWMSESRQNAVYRPEEPFAHNNLIKSGRLKIYDSLYGPFSKEFRTPCVIFTSHPTLRVGDAAHMVEVLAHDEKSVVILTEPDFTCDTVHEPYRNLPIRFEYIPMDFRMDFPSLQQILTEIKPKYVLCPSEYTAPKARRQETQIHYEKVWPMEYEDAVQLSKLSQKAQKLVTVSIHPDIVKGLEFKQHPMGKLQIAPIACHLSAYNDDFKLVPTKSKIVRRKYGRITVEKLLKKLRQANIKVKEPEELRELEQGEHSGKPLRNPTETILELEELNAKISLKRNERNIKITASKAENREKILEVVKSMLVEDDGIIGRRFPVDSR